MMEGRMERLVIAVNGNQPLKNGLQKSLMKTILLRDRNP